MAKWWQSVSTFALLFTAYEKWSLLDNLPRFLKSWLSKFLSFKVMQNNGDIYVEKKDLISHRFLDSAKQNSVSRALGSFCPLSPFSSIQKPCKVQKRGYYRVSNNRTASFIWLARKNNLCYQTDDRLTNNFSIKLNARHLNRMTHFDLYGY